MTKAEARGVRILLIREWVSEHEIESQLEHVIWSAAATHESVFEQGDLLARGVEARVAVHLEQPAGPLVVDYDVEAKQLEAVGVACSVQIRACSSKNRSQNLFDLAADRGVWRQRQLGRYHAEKLHVAFFESAEPVAVLLHRVVGQMNKRIGSLEREEF